MCFEKKCNKNIYGFDCHGLQPGSTLPVFGEYKVIFNGSQDHNCIIITHVIHVFLLTSVARAQNANVIIQLGVYLIDLYTRECVGLKQDVDLNGTDIWTQITLVCDVRHTVVSKHLFIELSMVLSANASIKF